MPHVRPTVTVIISTLNSATVVKRALRALSLQQDAADEVLLVDGGSSDDTVAVAAGFADRLPLRIVPAPGTSLGDARNIGLTQARSDLICFCDADDIYPPERIARHRAAMAAAGPDTLVFGGSAHFFTVQGEIGLHHSNRAPNEKDSFADPGIAVLRRTPHINAITIRKADLDARHLSFAAGKDGNLAEDYRFFTELVLAGFHFERLDGIAVLMQVLEGSLGRRLDRLEPIKGRHLASLENYIAASGIAQRAPAETHAALTRFRRIYLGSCIIARDKAHFAEKIGGEPNPALRLALGATALFYRLLPRGLTDWAATQAMKLYRQCMYHKVGARTEEPLLHALRNVV